MSFKLNAEVVRVLALFFSTFPYLKAADNALTGRAVLNMTPGRRAAGVI
jgi:hypothetical protein